MTRFLPRLMTATALSLTLAATPLVAEQTAAQTAALSAELYLAGMAADDPLLVLAAAKLRKGLDLQETEREPEKDMDPPEEDMGDAAPIGWEDILKVAVAMAPEDEIIASLADDIRSERTKGVKSGQLYSITTIRDGGTDTYPPLVYRGSEYADVYVEGNNGANLDLYVYDAQQRLVCSDTDISAIAHCGWTPAQEAPFTVVVRNRGRGATGYSLITN